MKELFFFAGSSHAENNFVSSSYRSGFGEAAAAYNSTVAAAAAVEGSNNSLLLYGYNYMAAAAAASAAGGNNPYQFGPLLNHSYAAPYSNASEDTKSANGLTLGQVKQEPECSDGRTSRASSTSGSESLHQGGQAKSKFSRDERKARELGITFPIDDIINLPMDEFNDLLSKHELSEEQLNLCRDIRRRGKNKVSNDRTCWLAHTQVCLHLTH